MATPARGAMHLMFACLCLAGLTAAYVQFEPVLVPHTDQERNSITASLKVTYGRFSLETFNKIARTREDHNCILTGCTYMGEVLDITRTNVTAYNKDTLEVATIQPRNGKGPGRPIVQFSHSPSGGILLQEEEVRRWFMLYQFENPNPGSIYRVRMRLENDTDLATLLSVPISFAAFGGLWKPRVATLTPSSSYLGTEGMPPDMKVLGAAECLFDVRRPNCLSDTNNQMFIEIMDFMRYFQRPPNVLNEEGQLTKPLLSAIPGFKAYRYGFPFEIALGVNEQDRVIDNVGKHYAMGRLGGHGLAVMQDGFNVYIAGGRTGLFRFVADSGEFTSGELFAALFKLEGSVTGEVTIAESDSFSIEWISLGKTNSEDVAEITSGTKDLAFREIFELQEADEGRCPEGLGFANIGGEGECLRVVDDKLAAVFEPERFAAVKGATVDVFKFAHMATQLDASVFYLAAEKILEGSLEVEKGGALGGAVARVAGNKCGCVFQVTINSGFEATKMKAIMCGDDKFGTNEDNSCNTEKIANPRPLTYANQFEYLLVGEDSEFHANNMVWAWDPETGKATRIFHSPVEGRITSLNWFQDVVGGNNYIGLTIAEPFDRFGWLSYFGSFDLSRGSKLSFSGVPVPSAKGPKELPIGFSRLTSGTAEMVGGWKTLFKTGQELKETGKTNSKVIIGQLVDKSNKPVDSYEDGPVKPERLERPDIFHKFGFTSLINMCDKVFSIGVVDGLPSASYIFTLEDNGTDLKTVSASHIDWSEWGGLWRPGSGAVSPWNTHLGGEAFEPDAANYVGFTCLTGFSSCFKSRAEKDFKDSILFLRYYDLYLEDLNNAFAKLAEVFNPYSYGYVYEAKADAFGCVIPTKFLTLGRFSHGAVQVMPDLKTVYMTDWTRNRDVGGGFFKFTADKPGDLTAGTLYAAKFNPVRGTLLKYTIKWIELGSATNDELIEMSKTIKFTDMFNIIPPSKKCTLEKINVKSQVECLSIKKGMEKWAAFFETRRYAALQGASIELANSHGLVYDPNSKQMHMSFTRIASRDKIMLQDDIEASSNDIKVRLAPCGCLYNMSLTEDFDITRFEQFYCGEAVPNAKDSKNRCKIEKAANPGHLSVIPGHGLLLVAEQPCRVDSRGADCGHENGAVWVMDSFGKGRDITRIMSVPFFTTPSSTVWYPNIQGNAYITGTVNELYARDNRRLFNPNDPEAEFGYLGPFTAEGADARREEIKAAEVKCYDERTSAAQCPINPKAPNSRPAANRSAANISAANRSATTRSSNAQSRN